MRNKIRSAFAEINADNALRERTAAYVRRRRKIFRLPLAAAVVMLVLTPIFAYNLYFTADAYVSIDVNPSLELTLNRMNRVIAADAFNEDGQYVLRGSALGGKSYDEATALLLSSMEAEGYLVENALISVSVRAADSSKEQLLCSSLLQLITERIEDAPAAEVEVFSVSEEIWSDARSCHISPAKYLAIQELLAVDEEATLEAYSDASICQIRERVQQCHDGRGQGHHGGGGHHGGR